VNTQRNFHLLACSPPILLEQSSPKFYTILATFVSESQSD